MTVQSRIDNHERKAAKAAKVLQDARDAAQKSSGYNSQQTRNNIRAKIADCNHGMVARDWQVDVGEAMILGVDCTVIATTGAGKSLPFVMPVLVNPEKVVVIISPLNALEDDLVQRYEKMGLSAVAVNGTCYDKQLHKDVQSGKYQVILTSPEMALENDKFRELLSSPTFSKKIAAFIVDEAHLIDLWGPQFRPEYAELGTLRSFVPVPVPFLAVTATLTPLGLENLRKSLHIVPDTSFHVHLGVDRPNIAWYVREMKAAKSDLAALDFIIPPGLGDGNAVQIPRTIVFFDDINLLLDALIRLRGLIPPDMAPSIAAYHARRSERSKRGTMARFRRGEIKILLATEAAGMGCDISDVERVVQFLVPGSLAIWLQRAGRAGRDPLTCALAILLVQPSMFKQVAGKDGALKFQKEVEPGLRRWVEALGCRRDIVDDYFDSGVVRKAPTGVCCDNCVRNATPPAPTASSSTPIAPAAAAALLSPDSNPTSAASSDPAPAGAPSAPAAASQTKYKYRPNMDRPSAEELIRNWRATVVRERYSNRPWGVNGFLSEDTIESLVKRSMVTMDEFVGAKWGLTHARNHWAELAALLAAHDAECVRKREQAAAEKKRLADEERAEKKRLADEAKAERKRLVEEKREEKKRLDAAAKAKREAEKSLSKGKPRAKPRAKPVKPLGDSIQRNASYHNPVPSSLGYYAPLPQTPSFPPPYFTSNPIYTAPLHLPHTPAPYHPHTSPIHYSPMELTPLPLNLSAHNHILATPSRPGYHNERMDIDEPDDSDLLLPDPSQLYAQIQQSRFEAELQNINPSNTAPATY